MYMCTALLLRSQGSNSSFELASLFLFLNGVNRMFVDSKKSRRYTCTCIEVEV